MECALGCGELPPGVEAAIRLMTPEEVRESSQWNKVEQSSANACGCFTGVL